MKKLIRSTESDLHRIVKESVNKMLNEAYGTPSQSDYYAKTRLNDPDTMHHAIPQTNLDEDRLGTYIQDNIIHEILVASRYLDELSDMDKQGVLGNFIKTANSNLITAYKACKMAIQKLANQI